MLLQTGSTVLTSDPSGGASSRQFEDEYFKTPGIDKKVIDLLNDLQLGLHRYLGVNAIVLAFLPARHECFAKPLLAELRSIYGPDVVPPLAAFRFADTVQSLVHWVANSYLVLKNKDRRNRRKLFTMVEDTHKSFCDYLKKFGDNDLPKFLPLVFLLLIGQSVRLALKQEMASVDPVQPSLIRSTHFKELNIAQEIADEVTMLFHTIWKIWNSKISTISFQAKEALIKDGTQPEGRRHRYTLVTEWTDALRYRKFKVKKECYDLEESRKSLIQMMKDAAKARRMYRLKCWLELEKALSYPLSTAAFTWTPVALGPRACLSTVRNARTYEQHSELLSIRFIGDNHHIR